MAKPEHVKCGNCVFFDHVGGEHGYCHAASPVKSHATDILTALAYLLEAVSDQAEDPEENGIASTFAAAEDGAHFVLMQASDWCGAFKAEWPA